MEDAPDYALGGLEGDHVVATDNNPALQQTEEDIANRLQELF